MIFNSDLVDDLARQRVVLFLGAGVSASAQTQSGTRMLGWEAFLDACRADVAADISAQVRELLDKKDYLLACEVLQRALEERWPEKVRGEYGQKATPSPLHHALIKLRQRFILTTNFDKLIEIALDASDQDSSHYYTVISSIDDKVFKALKDHSGRYVIKIHGTVDDSEGLVFSRSEYIKLAFGNARYSLFLENLLLNYTFLFVGFSMDDPAITSLMEMYALKYELARPHYLISSDSVPQNIIDINKRLRKLNYINYDPVDHHKNLPPLIEALAERADIRRREIYAAAVAHHDTNAVVATQVSPSD